MTALFSQTHVVTVRKTIPESQRPRWVWQSPKKASEHQLGNLRAQLCLAAAGVLVGEPVVSGKGGKLSCKSLS